MNPSSLFRKPGAIAFPNFLLISFLVFLFLSFAGEVLGAPQTAELMKIVSIEGDVKIKAPGVVESRPAVKGGKVEKGAELITGRDSSCLFGLKGKMQAYTRLFSDSRISVSPSDNPSVKLLSGKIFVYCKNPEGGSFFQVRTPNSVLSISNGGLCQTMSDVLIIQGTAHVINSGSQARDIFEGKGVHLDVGRFGREFNVPDDLVADWYEFKLSLKDKEFQTAENPKGSANALPESKTDATSTAFSTEEEPSTPSTPP